MKSLLGSPPKFYLFGEAPQGIRGIRGIWQQIGGLPENYLGQVPDMDSYSCQVDSYGPNAEAARGVAQVLRDAFEPYAHITAWNGESRDPDTREYRVSFTVEFRESR